ncbi:membrane protein YdbS with pleckstrin-like domain [Glaciihabitans tibetensis]|uniref:Membrane protein YdbS with pleckstrin-like domain n=1 Tax=Glaciihabitans tibetensis TaxID=1266600 RepID=A0A2T0VFA7_9MICO|nr:PH domain-containing protein [Glaciihabitans tibetensis]PRY68875.1 membrane protein YdbS with pleckstrin-like domain [Glaciihabitans tibetensis]
MSDETGPTSPEAERVIASLRPHARVLFWPSLVLIATAGLGTYFAGQLREDWQTGAVVVGAIVVAVLLWLLPTLAWLAKRYVITTRRIVLRQGLFVRTRQELLHSRGYDVTVRKHAMQSMFRSGNVQINTGLDHPVVLRDIPSADLVQAALHDLMESNQNSVSTRRQQDASRPTDETTAWGSR